MVCAQPESVQKNETHEILQEFESQTDYITPTRRPDLVMINKKKKENLTYSGLYRPGGKLCENQRKGKVRQVIGPCWRTKKSNRT